MRGHNGHHLAFVRVRSRSLVFGQNHRDAIETVEQAICETERLLGRPLAQLLVDEATGEIRPIALVTDG